MTQRSAHTSNITQSDLENLRKTAETIRALAVDSIQKANSGHPGMPMGMADTAALIWARYLKFDPQNPDWPDRDRFVLSAGHGSMLLYSLLHLSGYDLSMQDLMDFRQWGSRTPGHPEYGHTPGVETTTGPLGQGISNAVGLALAERWLAARYNRPDYPLVGHRTYVIAGDGDLMEGVSHEACSLAGHWGLGRLIVLFDDNHISIDGSTDLSVSEDTLKRFEAYGWQVAAVDGHDPQAVAVALEDAASDETRPSLIACRTTIGKGSPNRGGTSKAHGEPMGEEEIRLIKEGMGWPPEEKFRVLPEARALLEQAGKNGAAQRAAWELMFAEYEKAFPQEAAEFQTALRGELPAGWDEDMPEFTGPIATRATSGNVLEAIVPKVPYLLGGSADLTGSNKTRISNYQAVKAGDYGGNYIYYGVREHGMGSIMNGIAAHGGLIPFGGTFLVFSDYMRPAVRMAAMMKLNVVYVFTHDSIGLGEDGPTHQPVEHLASLRAIPGLTLIRPADGGETIQAWKSALTRRQGPTALVLTRQNLPQLDRAKSNKAANGAYVLAGPEDAQVILMASGSEVSIALDAGSILEKEGISARVVSMPSWEIFAAMPKEYQEQVLPERIQARVAVEAGSPMGWERFTGPHGAVIALDHFGASAPYETLYEKFGLTAQAVASAAAKLVK